MQILILYMANFTGFVESNDVWYYINEPMRIIKTSATTVLDQLVSTFPIFKKEIEILPPITKLWSLCNYSQMYFNIKNSKPYVWTMWNFKEANFLLDRDKLNDYNWDNCCDNEDIDIISDRINQNLLQAAKITIPNRKVTIRPSAKS